MPPLVLRGTVLTARLMKKTIKVRVDKQVKHPVVGKTITRSKNYLVHDAEELCNPRDVVLIQHSLPISKHKKFRLMEIVKRAEQLTGEEGVAKGA